MGPEGFMPLKTFTGTIRFDPVPPEREETLTMLDAAIERVKGRHAHNRQSTSGNSVFDEGDFRISISGRDDIRLINRFWNERLQHFLRVPVLDKSQIRHELKNLECSCVSIRLPDCSYFFQRDRCSNHYRCAVSDWEDSNWGFSRVPDAHKQVFSCSERTPDRQFHGNRVHHRHLNCCVSDCDSRPYFFVHVSSPSVCPHCHGVKAGAHSPASAKHTEGETPKAGDSRG